MTMDTIGDKNGSTLLRVEGLKTYFFQRNAVLKAVGRRLQEVSDLISAAGGAAGL